MAIWITLAVLVFIGFLIFIGSFIYLKYKNFNSEAHLQIKNALIKLGDPNYDFQSQSIWNDLFKSVRKEVISIRNSFGLARNNVSWESTRIEKNAFEIVKEFYEKDSGNRVLSKKEKRQNLDTKSRQIIDAPPEKELQSIILEIENEINKDNSKNIS
ncbi:hypothetical protein SSABA_v1c02070 [Spiroplasma sabaudiense Ar-1343]|uniref:Uncharacterized protein n=1 Tax=Spiroplasma sabaudiense Ar-1343 TaxID=1276257 RepID=W6AIT5_9MOLU|nr:hypothetical protein [Spiroplasma sabaudiense]AHI53619.1 hypothetical protein SSABA_v1c02070 [Spiroplasma sabaudiense Ar-1343]